jgi:nitrogen fixation/metabolism regulation signal transduction histidine kinase
MQEFSGVTTKLTWIVILILPLMISVILFFSHYVSRPIGLLISDAQSIEAGNFGVQVSERFGSREFQYLADAFNSMSYKLKYQFDRIYKEELRSEMPKSWHCSRRSIPIFSTTRWKSSTGKPGSHATTRSRR